MSTSYPRHMRVDFNKLRANTLKRYAWHYNLPQQHSNGETTDDLASACAKHFAMQLQVDELKVLSDFVNYCNNIRGTTSQPEVGLGLSSNTPGAFNAKSVNGTDYHSFADGGAREDMETKRRKIHPLPNGRKVAAKINNEWMLTRILKFSKRKKSYKVEDADEMTDDPFVYDVHQDLIICLPDPSDGSPAPQFLRGDRVLALFPGTSTFYAATVAKRFDKPKGRIQEYGLRFDDDEKDATGEVRMNRINAFDIVEYPE